jgi:hypothetical protein
VAGGKNSVALLGKKQFAIENKKQTISPRTSFSWIFVIPECTTPMSFPNAPTLHFTFTKTFSTAIFNIIYSAEGPLYEI